MYEITDRKLVIDEEVAGAGVLQYEDFEEEGGGMVILPITVDLVRNEKGELFLHVNHSLEGFTAVCDLQVTPTDIDLYLCLEDK